MSAKNNVFSISIWSGATQFCLQICYNPEPCIYLLPGQDALPLLKHTGYSPRASEQVSVQHEAWVPRTFLCKHNINYKLKLNILQMGFYTTGQYVCHVTSVWQWACACQDMGRKARRRRSWLSQATWQLSVEPISAEPHTQRHTETHTCQLGAMVSWAVVSWLGHMFTPCSHCHQQANNSPDRQRNRHTHKCLYGMCSTVRSVRTWEIKREYIKTRNHSINMHNIE